MQKGERLAWIDLIRVIGVFMVIGIHVSWHYVLVPLGTIPDSYWLFTNLADTCFACAVPLFFMISGYLILNKSSSLKYGFVKRLLKIIIPLLFWSVVYILVRRQVYGVDMMGNPVNVCNTIRCILSGKTNGHLWFLSSLASLYIAAPIIHSYLKSASRENKIYCLSLFGFVWLVYPNLCLLLKHTMNVDHVYFNFHLVSGGSLGYFVAGYFLGNLKINVRTCILCTISFIIIVFAIIGIGFAFPDSLHHINSRHFLTGRFEMPLVLMSFAVLKYLGSTSVYQRSAFSAGISQFAKLFFGIYLVHILVMHAIGDGILGFSLNIRTCAPWFSIPLTITTVFFLSAFVVWLLKKIPYAHWVLP